MVRSAEQLPSLFLFRGLWACVAAASLSFPVCQIQAEAVQIRVLDGHSGRPVRHVGVVVTFEPPTTPHGPSLAVTDANGLASIDVPASSRMDAIVDTHPTCRYVAKPERTKGAISFAVSDIVSTGVVETNSCSKRTDRATPGVLTLFVRPLHLWERLSD